MTDFATARRHMVDGQVRTADVTDLRILAAMLEIPRENFVPSGAAGLAYLDLDLAVGEAGARRLLKPMVLAKLIHAADVASSDRVLDVGCGTGYAAAILSRIAGQVITLEQDSGLAQTARAALASQPNVSVVSGPLVAGWPQGAPYDVILLEGATEIAPQAFLGQLKEWGPAGLRSRQRSRCQGHALLPQRRGTRGQANFRCQRGCSAWLCQGACFRLLIASLPSVAEIPQFSGNLWGRPPGGF